MKRFNGISLIVLVITIIVIIILAGSVILSITSSNPISKANEAKFKSNIGEYKSELAIAKSSKYLNDSTFKSSTLVTGAWDGTATNIIGTVKEYIKSITVEDGANFTIQDGKLVYAGSDIDKKKWAMELGLKLELASGNLYAQISPWSTMSNNIDVSLTEPGPIIGSKTWKMIKTGTSSQWNGWEGNYDGLFNGNVGDRWVISGWYKTSAAAGIDYFVVGEFYKLDWSRPYNTTLIDRTDKIIDDGTWHYLHCTIQLNEVMTNAIITDGPAWTYSSQSGVMYMNGIEWRKIPVGTY